MQLVIALVLMIIEFLLILFIFNLFIKRKISIHKLFDVGFILVLVGISFGCFFYIFQLGLDNFLKTLNPQEDLYKNLISVKALIYFVPGAMFIIVSAVGANFMSHHLLNKIELTETQKKYLENEKIYDIFNELKSIKKLLYFLIGIIFILLALIFFLLLR